MNISFDNRVVVITGAAGGIGKALVRRFAEDGAKVAVCDLRGAACTASEIGGTVKGYEFDITDRESTKAAMAEIVSDFGKIDVYMYDFCILCILFLVACRSVAKTYANSND